MKINKKFFMDLEELLQSYADSEESFIRTLHVTEELPAEAFMILALRCKKFMGTPILNVAITRTSGDLPLVGNEVRINFFPRGNYVFFSRQNDMDINIRMKNYLLNLKEKHKTIELDYTEECINLGFCVHCDKKTTILHPDYKYKRICDDCLSQRDMFLVVTK